MLCRHRHNETATLDSKLQPLPRYHWASCSVQVPSTGIWKNLTVRKLTKLGRKQLMYMCEYYSIPVADKSELEMRYTIAARLGVNAYKHFDVPAGVTVSYPLV